MTADREQLLCFALNVYFCNSIRLRNCSNFKNFNFVLAKFTQNMWLPVNITIGSHMSKQCFGSKGIKKEDDVNGLQNEMHVGCTPALARHLRGQREHVSMDWLLRLMGCWHFSHGTVETPETDWAGRESSHFPCDKQGPHLSLHEWLHYVQMFSALTQAFMDE